MKPETLLRLYPKAWRERYGDEFLALLEQEGVGPRVVLNVAASAFDAWVSPRTPGQPLAAGPIGPRVLLIPPELPPLEPRVLFVPPERPARAGSWVAQVSLTVVLFGLLFGLALLAESAWGRSLAVRTLGRGAQLAAILLGSVPFWFRGYTLRTKIAAGFWLLVFSYGAVGLLLWIRS